MNYCVPYFGMEEEDSLASAFGFINQKILTDSADDDMSEILWQKGPVVRRFPPPHRSGEPPERRRRRGTATAETAGGELFTGEDEMASWLHNSPENGGNAGGDNPAVVDRRPVVPPPPPPVATASRYVASRESTVVGSNVTVDVAPPPPIESIASMAAERSNSPLTCEKAPVSSSMATTHGDNRKRKARESDDSDAEDADYDSDDKKKDHRRPARRSRAAEVHNLSERRRRDRINEKMKALQQLIPRCNKSDKASMLDDAVEYIKSLQLQVQMMSTGYPMTPMMYPGPPQYAPPTGTPMGMGINTSSGCMTHPMLPFSPVMQSPPVPGASTGHLGARMPIPAFHPAAMAAGRQLRAQTTSQPDPQSNFMCLQAPNQVQMPNLPYPYHQYFGFQQMQFPSQGQTVTETGTSNASSTQEKSDSKLGRLRH